MIRHAICLVAIAASLSAAAATPSSKLDLSAQILLHDYTTGEQLSGALHPLSADSQAGSTVGVIVSFAPGCDASSLPAIDGLTVCSQVDGMAVISLPAAALEALAASDAVTDISAGQPRRPDMYFARMAGHIDQIHAGTGIDRAYDGSGVVIGSMDQGIDPNHINFTDGSDYSTSRVRAVYVFNSSDGSVSQQATTPGEIAAFTTDTQSSTHGTHVMGIAAGSYRGTGSYGLDGSAYSDADMPFCGVAPAADIVMSSGLFYDANIVAGVQKIIDYAASQGKPAVVNLSLGGILGPHDGSSPTCQYLSKLAEQAIIVIAAGNDGSDACAMSMTGSQLADNAVALDLSTSAYSPYVLQFWSDTADDFDLDFILYDANTDSIAYTLPVRDTGSGHVAVGGASSVSSYSRDDHFTAAFSPTSYASFWSRVEYGRYLVQMQCILNRASSSDYSLRPAVRVTRREGQSVYGYLYSAGGSAGVFDVPADVNVPGLDWSMTTASADGSISDLATAPGVISVGAYTSSPSFTVLTGASYHYNGATQAGQPCTFSSYGSNPVDGTRYPMVCAPGSAIVSSYSSHSYTSPAQTCATVTDAAGHTHLWGPMQGTSMATPFVTGTIALWLQANPTLTADDIADIITGSSTSYTGSDPVEAGRWGACGRLEPLAGLRQVLKTRSAGIDNVTVPGADTPDTADTPTLYYTLQGQLITGTPAPGTLCIRRQGPRATKTIIKY